jgi:23S rRNA (pseudouridine1915-N3)-methyltransferase
MIRRCTLVAVGKPKDWAAEGSNDYAIRLRRYFPVNIIEVAEEDMNRRSPKEVLAAEGERILKRLPNEAYVISLDREKGKQQSSERIALQLEDLGVSGHSHVAFVIGGPLGLWSFGSLTLPHALARVILLEQLYRAAKIHRNEKYHW